MIEMYKLARPQMHGVPMSILSGRPQGTENAMLNDILGGLPQFVGEIVVGSPTAPDCYERSKAFVDNPTGVHLFVFWVYDLRTTERYGLRDRLDIVQPFVTSCGANIQYVDHELIESVKALENYRATLIKQNFTGIILREPFGTFGTEDETLPIETAIV